MKRIRYNYNQESKLFECSPIFTGMGFVVARYNNITLEYSIINYDSKAIIYNGIGKNKTIMLKEIRQHLINLGAVIFEEVRIKRKG